MRACREFPHRCTCLGERKVRQVVQRRCNIAVLGSESFLVDAQRALIKWFRLGVFTFANPQAGEIVHSARDKAVIGSESLLIDPPDALKNRFCVAVLALVKVKRSEIVKVGRDARSVGPKRFFIVA